MNEPLNLTDLEIWLMISLSFFVGLSITLILGIIKRYKDE